jgi:hypothetical protein
MRKLILISAFVLASVSAQAGESRGLVLAANDEVKVAEAATPQASKTQSAKSSKTQTRRHETDEQKARRIAAKYGVYW